MQLLLVLVRKFILHRRLLWLLIMNLTTEEFKISSSPPKRGRTNELDRRGGLIIQPQKFFPSSYREYKSYFFWIQSKFVEHFLSWSFWEIYCIWVVYHRQFLPPIREAHWHAHPRRFLSAKSLNETRRGGDYEPSLWETWNLILLNNIKKSSYKSIMKNKPRTQNQNIVSQNF